MSTILRVALILVAVAAGFYFGLRLMWVLCTEPKEFDE